MNQSDQTQQTTETPGETIGKAYQFVALSASIIIQDATDHLRNMNTICTSIIGAALAQAIENPGTTAQMEQIVGLTNNILNVSGINCDRLTRTATDLLKNFQGASPTDKG